MLTIYLNSLNINLIIAYNSIDAIEIFKKQKDKIDLIILDLNSTGSNVLQLIDNLIEEDNDCKIITKSGEAILNNNILYHFKNNINKRELVSILNELWQK
jgi:DNA-binding NtrC family response regulator